MVCNYFTLHLEVAIRLDIEAEGNMSDVELVDVSGLARDETNKLINDGKNVFYASNLDSEKLMDFIIACIQVSTVKITLPPYIALKRTINGTS